MEKRASTLLDPYGQFPLLCPNDGSNYSVMLNDASSHAKAQRLSYTFQAPSSGPYSIIFNYAVVLEDPGHQPYQQPKFTAFVYDVTDGEYINCPSFDFVASAGLPGFQPSKTQGGKNASVISSRGQPHPSICAVIWEKQSSFSSQLTIVHLVAILVTRI